jgi:hypothetical protein
MFAIDAHGPIAAIPRLIFRRTLMFVDCRSPTPLREPRLPLIIEPVRLMPAHDLIFDDIAMRGLFQAQLKTARIVNAPAISTK